MMKFVIFLSAVFILAACTTLPKRQVETVIDIPAPRSAVWGTLIDTQAYQDWNPFIVKMEGEIIEGGRITNTMMPSPDKRMVFKPKVLTVNAGRELRWLGRLYVAGLFDGEHYFILEDTETGTKLTHGEIFSGLMLLFMDVQKFEDNFHQMNLALSARAQSIQRRQLNQ